MKGVEVIKLALENMFNQPGVYRMIGENDKILYIGKAKNLRNRLSNYTLVGGLSSRIALMVYQVQRVEVTTTISEVDALLLEARLIKEHRPPYNILLRDDKSFPYIAFDKSSDFPRIFKHRGQKNKKCSYYGPFPSAHSVNNAISTLQKSFLIRPCSDSFFRARKKPCMEYQIKRCSAPCVNHIGKEEYNLAVSEAEEFLSGKTQEVKKHLQDKMQAASEAFEYEIAASYRNRISALSTVQSKQGIHFSNIKDADVIAIATAQGKVCIQVFFVRGGHVLGNTEYFPTHAEDLPEQEVLEFFITSFYENKPVSRDIILSHDIFNKELIAAALQESSGKKVDISFPQKGERRQVVEMALSNARNSLERKLAEEEKSGAVLQSLKEIFGITRDIRRVEVFDNSHIFGKSALGAMIVAGYDEENKWCFLKKHYRKFNFDSAGDDTGGDDFEMMRKMMRRRYGRLKDEGSKFPELILIDGGAGQLSVVMEVFRELEIENQFDVIAIAKGPDRNAGNEEFFMPGKAPMRLTANNPVLFFLQNMRDEVHRFVITGHRKRFQKANIRSRLDDVPDLGPVRRKALLIHFGSVKLIEAASIEALSKVSGINKKTAEKIYGFFHENS